MVAHRCEFGSVAPASNQKENRKHFYGHEVFWNASETAQQRWVLKITREKISSPAVLLSFTRSENFFLSSFSRLHARSSRITTSTTHQSRWHSKSLFAYIALIRIGRLHLLTSTDIARGDLRGGLLRVRLGVTRVSALRGESHVALLALERLGGLGIYALIRAWSVTILMLRLRMIIRCQQLVSVIILLRRRRSVNVAIGQVYQLSLLRLWRRHLTVVTTFTNYHLVWIEAKLLLVLAGCTIFWLHDQWHRVVNHFFAEFGWDCCMEDGKKYFFNFFFIHFARKNIFCFAKKSLVTSFTIFFTDFLQLRAWFR